MDSSHPVKEASLVGGWYNVTEMEPNFFRVDEADHVTFYVLKSGTRALFIDSGLGLDQSMAAALLKHIGITEFDVLNTHAHCDHVGLNYLAKRVWIGKQEWEKYGRQDEVHQLEHYHAIYRSEAWPKVLGNRTPTQVPWQPTDFVGTTPIEFAGWSLQPVALPGHSEGSIGYVDSKSGKIFSGDFIYDGALYLHLKDSSIEAFRQSLDVLDAVVAKIPGAAFYPGHNSIPLPVSYLQTVREVLAQIVKGEIDAKGNRPGDSMFEPASLYEAGSVKAYIKGK